jgi:undecaprenyl-diphosphatase
MKLGDLVRSPRAIDALVAFSLLSLLLVRLFVISTVPVDLSGDEAHYWEWSRNLAPAYYSKGPAIAILIAAARSLFGDTEFAVRFQAAFLTTLFMAFSYLAMRFQAGARSSAIALLAMASTPIFAQAGLLMTTDAPAILFWLLACLTAHRALYRDAKGYWLLCGLFLGFGLWSKYTVALLALALFFLGLGDKESRRSLYFWSGIIVSALLLTPIVYWNHQHSWVNVLHNSRHVVKAENFSLRLKYLPELLAGQLGLLGPILAFLLVYLMWSVWKSRKRLDDAVVFWLWVCLPLLFTILSVSLWKRVYANWPLPVYVSLFVLLAIGIDSIGKQSDLSNMQQRWGRCWNRWHRSAIGLSLFLTCLAHAMLFGLTLGLPGKVLPVKKLVGWRETSENVELMRVQEEFDFIASDHYGLASALSFYLNEHPFVYQFNLDDRRMTQYDIWTNPTEWASLVGKNALLVIKSEDARLRLPGYFDRVEEVNGSPFPVELSGDVVRTYAIYRGYSYRGQQAPKPSKH